MALDRETIITTLWPGVEPARRHLYHEPVDAILDLVAANHEAQLASAEEEYVAQAALAAQLEEERDAARAEAERLQRQLDESEKAYLEGINGALDQRDELRPIVAAAIAWREADANDVNSVLSTGRALREAIAALTDAQRDAARRG